MSKYVVEVFDGYGDPELQQPTKFELNSVDALLDWYDNSTGDCGTIAFVDEIDDDGNKIHMDWETVLRVLNCHRYMKKLTSNEQSMFNYDVETFDPSWNCGGIYGWVSAKYCYNRNEALAEAKKLREEGEEVRIIPLLKKGIQRMFEDMMDDISFDEEDGGCLGDNDDLPF